MESRLLLELKKLRILKCAAIQSVEHLDPLDAIMILMTNHHLTAEEVVFHVANHHLTAVEVDATYTKPLGTKAIGISDGYWRQLPLIISVILKF